MNRVKILLEEIGLKSDYTLFEEGKESNEVKAIAKKRGIKIFDFEGIIDPRIKATRRWHGFTHFKRGFGGEEVTYLGSFIKFYNPVIKLIFSLNRFF